MNAEKWTKANKDEWTYTGEWKQEEQEEGKKISFFKVQKNSKLNESKKTKGNDGLPLSAQTTQTKDGEEKKTDAAPAKPVIEAEKNGPKDDQQTAMKKSANEPNVPMDQVRDKLQTLADKGEVELMKSQDLKPKDDKKDDEDASKQPAAASAAAAASADPQDADDKKDEDKEKDDEADEKKDEEKDDKKDDDEKKGDDSDPADGLGQD